SAAVIREAQPFAIAIALRSQLSLAVEGVGGLVGAEQLVGAADGSQSRKRARRAGVGAVVLLQEVQLLPILAMNEHVAVCLHRQRARVAIRPTDAEATLDRVRRGIAAGESERDTDSRQSRIHHRRGVGTRERIDRFVHAAARTQGLATDTATAAECLLDRIEVRAERAKIW